MKWFCLQELGSNIKEKIKYVMMDADDAEYNAVTTVFPRSTVLMCWFYVMKNVKEHLKTL